MSTTPPPPPHNPYQAAPAPLSPADEKLWATLTHVGGIFFGFLPALIVYLVLKDRGPFVHQHSATALNFQLTMLIAYVIGFVTAFILIGFLILFAVMILVIILSIMAAIAANNGQPYKYPLAIEFVK